MAADQKDHPIFSSDPAEWMDYLYKEVCVTTDYDTSHTGRVYTIDPVSQSVVLAKFIGDDIKFEVVMGHCVQSIVVLDEETEKHRTQLDLMFKPKELRTASPEELKMKQNKLKSWLLKNRIPVAVSGTNSELLCISDALTIEPPYNDNNCQSTNEIILGRIQGLIKNMPVDIADWE